MKCTLEYHGVRPVGDMTIMAQSLFSQGNHHEERLLAEAFVGKTVWRDALVRPCSLHEGLPFTYTVWKGRLLWASLVPWQDTFITTPESITITSQVRIAALHRLLSGQFGACYCILSTRSLGGGPTNRSLHSSFLIHVNGSQRTLPLANL